MQTSDEGQPLRPEHTFKKIIWRNVLNLSSSSERLTSWVIAGLAAIIGLVIANLDSVSQIITQTGLRRGLLFLIASLLFGFASKQYGIFIPAGIENIQKMENLLMSEEGVKFMANISDDPKKLMQEVAEPFLWPLSVVMRKAAEKGFKDYLSADKQYVKMFCIQLYLSYIQTLLAIAGLVIFALSIRPAVNP